MKHEIPRWVNSAYDRRRSEQDAEIVKPGIEEAAYDAQDFGMFWILAVIVWLFFMIAATVYDNIRLMHLLTK